VRGSLGERNSRRVPLTRRCAPTSPRKRGEVRLIRPCREIRRIRDSPGRHRLHPENLPLAGLMKADYEKLTTLVKASGMTPH
jgi:hypothetical protein